MAELWIDRVDAMPVAGVVRAGRVVDLRADGPNDGLREGAVLWARVTRASGAHRFGQIGDRTVQINAAGGDRGALREGAIVALQITGEPRENKVAEATTDIGLAGRYLVYRPFGGGVGSARRIAPAHRAAIAEGLPDTGGWLIRTHAQAATMDAIRDEAAQLVTGSRPLVRAVSDPPTTPSNAPILAGLTAAQRLILDTADPTEIVVPDTAAAGALRRWCQGACPDLADRVTVGPIDLAETVQEALAPVTRLPSGGRLIIEPTAALTAIDVDQAAADTAPRTNLEACHAVARLVRLANLGGIVVVDLIGAPSAGREATPLLDALDAGFQDDGAARTMAGIDRLGLLRFSRQRRGLDLRTAMMRHRALRQP